MMIHRTGQAGDHGSYHKCQDLVAHDMHAHRRSGFLVLPNRAEEQAKARTRQPVHEGQRAQEQAEHDVVVGHVGRGIQQAFKIQTQWASSEIHFRVDRQPKDLGESNRKQGQIGAP